MRKILLLTHALLFLLVAPGQVLPASEFSSLAFLPKQKFDNYLSKKGFVSSGANEQGEMIVYNYFSRAKNKKEMNDSCIRFVSRSLKDDAFSFIYQTSSLNEAMEIRSELKKMEFYCSGEKDKKDSSLFFQRRDMTVRLTSQKEDSTVYYSFLIKRKLLPEPKKISYAEDLLAFDSHENLVCVFGANNVKKDNYYFTETQVARCSVLFPNTSRQAIYLWQDEENSCHISYLLIGGNLRVESSLSFNQVVGQNLWTLRNGVRAGMSLQELTKINGADFKFYGMQSEFSGMVVPENTGLVNFKKTGVMLSCLNCNDGSLSKIDIISAGDAIEQSKRLYVFTIILMPGAEASD